MTTWEFKAKRIETHFEPAEIENVLNALGKEGWELITVIQVIGTHGLAFFKRSLASDVDVSA